MRLEYSARTDTGRKRKGNEDSFIINDEEGLFVVADGLGGHAAGEVASRLAVESIEEFVRMTGSDREITWPFEIDDSMPLDANRLKIALRLANRKVIKFPEERHEYQGMATTVVSMLFSDSTIYIGHVGDSRAYRVRDGQITQLTNDHSWVNEQVVSGVLTSNQARNHPLRNVVTRAVGSRWDLQVDLLTEDAKDGDLYLLCSDGLSTMLDDDEILQILKAASTAEAACERLIERANEAGGEDNITAIVIRCQA
ncbi:MAG: Stp1/IreP family PP2C-type Ser/Thr phosphatase [Acidobacteria bacterium]|nr:Stp1/IreP family PP2C-type Ser/Thr phosphatase [Acidobacteriota bacterium]